MPSFTIVPQGPFDLTRAANFGFGPRAGAAETTDPRMELAFCRDDLEGYAGVTLTQDADGVHGEVEGGGDVEAVKRQVARVLSLDGDGDAFLEVGERDPILGELQQQHPGLRPVLFHSPYEAACWAIISIRRPAAHAAETRRRIAERYGETFSAGAAFPTPGALLALDEMKGLNELKVERLHAIATAALEDELEQPDLIAMDPDAAAERLQRLAGIGPFYAMLIVIRALGHRDVAPGPDRFAAGAARFYGDRPWDEVTAGWRPFRTWASVLVTYAARRAAAAGAPG